MDELNVSKGIFRADRLREVMDAHGATVDDIAEVAKKYTTYNRYHNPEAYRRIAAGVKLYPNIFELAYICEAVNVSADYLLGLSERVN